jgi:hypothetical protein
MRSRIVFVVFVLIALGGAPMMALAQTPAPPTPRPTTPVAPAPAGAPGQPTVPPPRAVGVELHQAPPTPPHAPMAPARAPSLPAIQSNIKIDLTITDSMGTAQPLKKTLSLIVLNGNSGMIRTSNRINGYPVGVDVDASAQVWQNGAITVRVTFEYTPLVQGEGANAAGTTRPELHESLTVLLQDGKPLLVSQSADPASDRKVTVELTATVLK